MNIETIVAEYKRRTEEFDKTVCTGPVIDGIVWPKNSKEKQTCLDHAKEVFESLIPIAGIIGVSRKGLEKAIDGKK